MKHQSFALIIVLMVAVACDSNKSVRSYTPKFKISEDSFFKISADQEYTFGYLEVPENRSKPDSKIIKLPVYIFKSRNPNPKSDPIIYTVGGPGSTTMPTAQYMKYYSYLDDRDFILFEQRGNYYALPHLDCPEWSKAIYQSNLPDFDKNNSDTLLALAAENCRQRLVDKGIDLDGYNTNEIAADIEDLRIALGLEQYNLLTISYSTKIAQVLLRDYAHGIRSVVMDSPLPLEVSYDEESVANLLEVLEGLLSDCESNPECKDAFPNIKNRFFDYLQRVTETPLEVSVENPISGKTEIFYLSGKDIITVFTSASTGDIPDILLKINAILNNDLSAVKEQLAKLFKAPGAGNGLGMRLSVWCAEEYPFSSQKVVKAETNKYPQTKGLSPAVFDAVICEIWSVKKAGKIENQPVKSDIPVLLISGEYDNETPVKWAKEMQTNLTNSYHLVFKGWKHTPTTNWGNQCAMKMANIFFNDPGRKPESKCFEAIDLVRFKTE